MSELNFFYAAEVRSNAMLHGASPDEAVSARGPIAIRYRSPLRFSKENDFYKADFFKKSGEIFVVSGHLYQFLGNSSYGPFPRFLVPQKSAQDQCIEDLTW